MSLFNWGSVSPTSIQETVAMFQELAGPLVSKGDINAVNRLYALAYAQAMQGREKQPLEKMLAQQALAKALNDILTRPARERRRYFSVYRDGWWRNRIRR